jgi:crotonobetainyl-CoA:carnitine CoA-transferase CaiB-like acyl-CoA transferase
MNCLYEERRCDIATRDKDWIGYGALLASGEEPMQEYDRIVGLIAGFLASRSKADLFSLALKRGLLIAPVATVGEVLASPQLEARQYWRVLEHPELGRGFPYPGPFARFSERPILYRRRPPLVGEHNDEVYSRELGLSAEQIRDLAQREIV